MNWQTGGPRAWLLARLGRRSCARLRSMGRWVLGSGSVVVAITSWTIGIPELAPWEHFVPALPDLSDLEARVDWAIHSPDAPGMAARARALYTKLRAADYISKRVAAVLSDPPEPFGASELLA